MKLKRYFTREERNEFTVSEIVTTLYIAITTVMTLLLWNSIEKPFEIINIRIWFMAFMLLFYVIHHIYPCRITWLMRILPHLLLLVYWYPETYIFARCHSYFDHIFANIDWLLFGFQPSIEFCKHVTSLFWYEAFNMGYYSYYYIMSIVLLFCLVRRYKDSERYIFIFMASFFSYYLCFELFPVAGPYYYFKAIGLEAARNGIYPDLGNYFAYHNDLNTDIIHAEIRGVFSELVHRVQLAGENPVGAFPSSHVGMSTVTMIMAWKTHNRILFCCLLPFHILLCLATVYIMAHYVIDSITGCITAFMLFWFYNNVYRLMHKVRYIFITK